MALAETRAASDALRTLLVALAPLRSAANLFHVDTLDQLLLSTNNQNKSLGQASKIEIWLLFHLKVIPTLKYSLPAAGHRMASALPPWEQFAVQEIPSTRLLALVHAPVHDQDSKKQKNLHALHPKDCKA